MHAFTVSLQTRFIQSDIPESQKTFVNDTDVYICIWYNYAVYILYVVYIRCTIISRARVVILH